MSRVAISSPGDLDFGGLVSHQLDVPDAIGKIIFRDRPKLYDCLLYVTAEDEKLLEVRSNGKRKHEENEEEGCKYLRLERRHPQKLITIAITVAGDVWKRKFKKSQLQVAFGG
ncbi:unnamed protein product [Lactuca virosa]|uniref:Uncharacterized protein n=1 Tax=Lactuca virosa TaxID=75947 RepID=A0AAU9LN39_9ASTR|nr:unnamed protein product [Lactuca virosa]